MTRPPAKIQGSFKMAGRQVPITHGIGQETEDAVDADVGKPITWGLN